MYLEKDICFYCEKYSFEGLTHAHCKMNGAVEKLNSVFHYSPTLKKIIANIKYRLVSDAFNELFPLIAIKFDSRVRFNEGSNLYIQPIPLHPNRLKQRGFNQSELIAKWLVSTYGGEMGDFLERVKETRTQAQLGRDERRLNAKNAFCLKKRIKVENKHILLVDDVVTTGSTVDAAAAVFKQAGAAKITVFSLAKG
jgi:competence protein ComFC